MSRNYTDFNKISSSTEDKLNKQIKTTDVNILLNRVKLDKKKTFKKNIFVLFLLVVLVSLITIFFTI